MKFLADVNTAQSVINFLRQNGHDVLDAKKVFLLAKDVELITIAQKEDRVVLTRDRDFEYLIRLPKYQVPVILVRLPDQSPEHIIEHLEKLLLNKKEETLINSLTILEEESAKSYPY